MSQKMKPQLMISKGLLDTIISAWLRLLVEETIMLSIYMVLKGLQTMAYPTHTRPTKRYKMGQMWCSMWMNIEKSKDAEPAADSYDTYILTELNFPDSDRNALYGRVRKIVRNYYGQYIGVVNRNSILDTSKYKVEYLAVYIE